MSKNTKNQGGALMDQAPVTKGTHTSGRDLIPDIDARGAGTDREYHYWIGLTPEAPSGSVTLGNVCFPKLTQKVQQGPDGKTQRIPIVGKVQNMTAERFLRMRESISRTVFRFVDQKDAEGKPKGYPVTIPSAQRVAEAEAAGRPIRRYIPQPNDEPAARYMFALLCENQDKPAPGHEYPDVLENTGLDWPDKL